MMKAKVSRPVYMYEDVKKEILRHLNHSDWGNYKGEDLEDLWVSMFYEDNDRFIVSEHVFDMESVEDHFDGVNTTGDPSYEFYEAVNKVFNPSNEEGEHGILIEYEEYNR